MAETVEKDDLKALLKVMSLLTQIEDRTVDTNQMFGPLKEIVQMLKEYQFVFGSKVYTQVSYRSFFIILIFWLKITFNVFKFFKLNNII